MVGITSIDESCHAMSCHIMSCVLSCDLLICRGYLMLGETVSLGQFNRLLSLNTALFPHGWHHFNLCWPRKHLYILVTIAIALQFCNGYLTSAFYLLHVNAPVDVHQGSVHSRRSHVRSCKNSSPQDHICFRYAHVKNSDLMSASSVLLLLS